MSDLRRPDSAVELPDGVPTVAPPAAHGAAAAAAAANATPNARAGAAQHETAEQWAERFKLAGNEAKVSWNNYVIGAATILLLALLVASVGGKANGAFADGAAVLAMVSLVAVGIERVIEAFWTLVARKNDAWWPLNQIGQAVSGQVDAMNAAMKPVFDTAITELTAAKSLLASSSAEAQRLETQINDVIAQKNAYVDQVKKVESLTKDGQRVNLIATAAIQASSRVDTALGTSMPAVREVFNDATLVATGAVDLVAGFKDNPAKKVISLALGMVIGLFAAAFLRLDLFAAAGAPLPASTLRYPFTDVSVLPFVGVAVTGIVLGLGSNPTHQVVSLVTDAAKARRTAALGAPETGDGAQGSEPEAVQSSGLGGALAAARSIAARAPLATSATVRIPASRLAPTVGVDHAELGDNEIQADLSGLVAADLFRTVAGGRRMLRIPVETVAPIAGIDSDALIGQSIEADMTGLPLPRNVDAPGVASPPRVRPVSQPRAQVTAFARIRP